MSLKKFYDAAEAAEARVQQIAAQIDEQFEAGKTDEATALKPQLDKAKADAKAANELYLSMKAAGGEGQKFTPVSERVEVIKDEADQPFKNAGEFFRAVKNAALYPSRADARLRPLKDATGMSEGIPADGGYLLQPQYASGILENMFQEGQILNRVSMDPVGPGSNSVTYNAVDETARTAGSRWGGVRGYWVGEGSTITSSKPTFRQVELKLKKVAALCYATDEQLEDIGNLESWLGRVVPMELRFLAENAIFAGDGVGKPLGILNAPCLVSHTRLDGSKVQLSDVVGMWARRYAGVNDYVWYTHQDVVPQLLQLNATYEYFFMPPGGLSATPYGTLFGKPVIEIEHCSTLGTVGDIVLASMSQYQAISKGGIKSAASIHVSFATDETAFRFVYRIDGAPIWSSALTPLNGSNTVSPFVALSTSS